MHPDRLYILIKVEGLNSYFERVKPQSFSKQDNDMPRGGCLCGQLKYEYTGEPVMQVRQPHYIHHATMGLMTQGNLSLHNLPARQWECFYHQRCRPGRQF